MHPSELKLARRDGSAEWISKGRRGFGRADRFDTAYCPMNR
jgi:hypothetical protein